MPYRVVKTKHAKTVVFLNVEDPEAVDSFRVQYGNRDLVISGAFYELADLSSPCAYALCFRIKSNSLEQVSQRALEVVYYLAENWGVPAESIDLIYNGEGIVAEDDSRANACAATLAEIVILVPPVVFGGRPTPLMLAMNYDLACEMHQSGMAVEIDVYSREQQFVPLPDSISEVTGRFAVLLHADELFYLGPNIVALSRQMRGGYIICDCTSRPRSGGGVCRGSGQCRKTREAAVPTAANAPISRLADPAVRAAASLGNSGRGPGA